MLSSSNLMNHKPGDPIGIQVLSARNILKDDDEEFEYEPAELIKQSREAFTFKIDRALSIGSNIAIKKRKEPSAPKAIDDVYEVYKGRVQSCVKIESSSQYEVSVKIIETVLQTEVLTTRFKRK